LPPIRCGRSRAERVGRENALERQRSDVDPEDPDTLLREVVERLIHEGYREVSPLHVSLELRIMLGKNWGKESTTALVKEIDDPRWIGEQLWGWNGSTGRISRLLRARRSWLRMLRPRRTLRNGAAADHARSFRPAKPWCRPTFGSTTEMSFGWTIRYAD